MSADGVTVAGPHAPVHGSLVGPWLIHERLGSGSFGVVYEARRAGHPEAEPVALKMAKSPWDERFEREVKVLESSHHPGIPRLEDRGVWTGPGGQKHPYLTMELVQGFTLYAWLEAQPRTSRQVLQVLAQLADALASAHARGVIHRDVKGDNIRVTPEGRAVLVDWGSCWLADGRCLTDSPVPPGTSAYRPPEQRGFRHTFRKDDEARWESRPSDDMYSLGVTLYRLVTGRYLPPCTDGDGLIDREVPPPTDRATVALELETLILRLIADDRAARGTAAQLAHEAAVLAENGGSGLDQSILPTASALPTESGPCPCEEAQEDESASSGDSAPAPSRRPPPPRSSSTQGERYRRRERMPPWLMQAAASALGAGVVVALAALLIALPTPQVQTALQPNPTPWLATPEEVAQFAPDAGVGDEALTRVEDVERRVGPWILSLGRPMPSKPRQDQRRPPCERGETEINGGCWVLVGNEKPPCGDKMFDYEGGCYFASFTGPKTPTSGTP